MRVVFAYIPVVHAQVLTFLCAHKDIPLWLLDTKKAKDEYVYLERDARALDPEDIQRELVAHGITDISIVSPQELPEKTKGITAVIIPEDEALRFFLEKYTPNINVEPENIFIRWTQKLSTTEFEVPPNRTMTTDHFAQEILSMLEDEAQKSPDWWRQIAAAVVRNGNVLVTAYNAHFPSAHALEINGDPRSNFDAGQGPGIYTSIHAEACVLARAAKDGIKTEGSDLYVTTFPCPTCARSLVEAGITRVFYKKGYSLLDAEEILKGAGIEIILVTD